MDTAPVDQHSGAEAVPRERVRVAGGWANGIDTRLPIEEHDEEGDAAGWRNGGDDDSDPNNSPDPEDWA